MSIVIGQVFDTNILECFEDKETELIGDGHNNDKINKEIDRNIIPWLDDNANMKDDEQTQWLFDISIFNSVEGLKEDEFKDMPDRVDRLFGKVFKRLEETEANETKYVLIYCA